MIKKLALAAVCAIDLTSPAYAASIQITDAEAEMEADDTADLYMTITNTGSTTDRLYAVKTKVAKIAKLVAISEAEETAQKVAGEEMTDAATFEVPAGGSLVLSEDGFHIELQQMTKKFQEGDTIMVTLFFENAGGVKVELEVEEE